MLQRLFFWECRTSFFVQSMLQAHLVQEVLDQDSTITKQLNRKTSITSPWLVGRRTPSYKWLEIYPHWSNTLCRGSFLNLWVAWTRHLPAVTYCPSHFHLIHFIYQSSFIHFMYQSPAHPFRHSFPSHSFYTS